MISAVFIGAAVPIAMILLSSSEQRTVLRDRSESVLLEMASTMAGKLSETAAAQQGPQKTAEPHREGDAGSTAAGAKWWPGKVEHGAKRNAPRLQLKQNSPLLHQLKKTSLADNATAPEASDGGNQTSAEDAGTVEAQDDGKKEEASSKADAISSEKVEVRLYMESKCPACKAYSTHFIKKLLETPTVKDFVDFKFVPWGNGVIKNKAGETINTTKTLTAAVAKANDDADYLQNLTFYCQHGGEECAGNAVESCIQAQYPKQEQFFPVIDCIEKRACAEDQHPPACSGSPAQVTGRCLSEFGPDMDKDAIERCASGTDANKLLLDNALATAQLQPAKAWVPWVTIDGKNLGGPDPSTFTQMFLIGQVVCGVWANKTGQEAPKECAQFPSTIPKDPYPDEDDDSSSGGSEGVNWWIVGLSLVAFIGAIAAMYFLLYNATKTDTDGMEPLHRDTSDWGGVDRD